MDKKPIKKIAAKDADQYMLRLPPGLRDRVASRAADNGRSMNTEIVEAIEKHLTRAARVTQLWELFGKHQENIEAIPMIFSAVEDLEAKLDGVWYELCFLIREIRGGNYGHYHSEPPSELVKWIEKKRHDDYVAYVATLPVVTADQARTIKGLLKEMRYDEKEEELFLAEVGASRIEEIRGFKRVMKLLREKSKYRPIEPRAPRRLEI